MFFGQDGDEQEEFCSRLYFKCRFTLLCSSCVEMLNWLTIDFVKKQKQMAPEEYQTEI